MRTCVGMNLQPIATSALTGIGTYTLEVVRRLSPLISPMYELEYHVFDFLQRNGSLDRVSERIGLKNDKQNRMRSCNLFPLGAFIRAGKIPHNISYQRLLRSRSEVTVFFNYLIPDHVAGKTITTVYDMVAERYPETMDRRNRRLLNGFLRRSCQRADAIVTISDFSKKEIIDCLHIPSEKIYVAHCGYDKQQYFPPRDQAERNQLRAAVAAKYAVYSPYILYLGTLEPRKNVDTLFDMFILMREQFPELKLVISGGLGWNYEKTLERIQKLDLGDSLIQTGYIPEEDKRMLYVTSELFVFPSLYEGFGLPVLEAMACGVPVVCSRASSLPEVVGDAGLLCDPKDPQEFARAASAILTDKELRGRLFLRQMEQIQRFSWEKASQVFARAISDVIELENEKI